MKEISTRDAILTYDVPAFRIAEWRKSGLLSKTNKAQHIWEEELCRILGVAPKEKPNRPSPMPLFLRSSRPVRESVTTQHFAMIHGVSVITVQNWKYAGLLDGPIGRVWADLDRPCRKQRAKKIKHTNDGQGFVRHGRKTWFPSSNKIAEQ